MTDLGRVLAAVDLGAGSVPVIRYGLALAQAAGKEFAVLHVVSSEEQEERASTPGDSRFVDVMVKDAERTLRDLVEAAGPGGVAYQCLARVGQPVDEILRLAEHSESLLVVGMRRRSRVGKFLLGSDLQELLLSSSRPLVVVPIDPEMP